MTYRRLVLTLVAACGASDDQPRDAAPLDDAAPDATPDGPPDAGCQDRVLLVGGTDVAAQGWTVVAQAPNTLTYGADHVQLQTSTNNGARTSGQQLLTYASAVPVDMPFKLEVVTLVVAANAHNLLDAGAAILASFTGPVGLPAERDRMIYLDSAAIGWADDTQSHAVAVADGAYHAYVVSVTGQTADVTIDGTPALSRTDFTTNGTIAIGDQTNDPNVDSTMRIRSVKLLCP